MNLLIFKIVLVATILLSVPDNVQAATLLECEEGGADYGCVTKPSPTIAGVKWLLERVDEIDPKGEEEATKTLKPGLSALKTYADGHGTWKNKLSIAYEGESGSNSSNEDESINLSFEFNRDSFPFQNRFKIDVAIDEDDKTVDDAITKFLYNFDYYIPKNPGWVEYELFLFTERFSNDDMLIEERWEVGGGIKFELNLGLNGNGLSVDKLFKDSPLKKRTSDIRVSKERSDDMAEKFTSLGSTKYSNEYYKTVCGDKGVDSCSETFNKNLTSTADWTKSPLTLRGLRHVLSRVQVGLSVAVLKEYTKGSVNLIGAANEEVTDFKGKSFSFDMEQDRLTVVSVRPTLAWAITDELALNLSYYHKRRMSDGKNARIKGSNYYSIRAVSLNYKLSDTASIELGYAGHFDNAPYDIGTVDLSMNDELNKALMGVVIDDANRSSLFGVTHAPSRHEKVTISVKIEI